MLPVRAQRRTPRASARAKHSLSPARKYVELADFGAIRSLSANEMETMETHKSRQDRAPAGSLVAFDARRVGQRRPG